MATTVVIVRHGLAQCALDSVVGGMKGCTGLAEEGRRQAERLRDRLVESGELAHADVLLTSTLPRAVETAEIIAPGLGRAGESGPKQDEELSELFPGEADGMTWTAYNERYGVDMRADPYAPIAPGGESIATFMLRAGKALTRVVAEHDGETVVIAAHGGIVWGSMHTFLNLPLRTVAFFEAENTSVTEWQIETGAHKLVRYNDAAHLA
jgi:probable phosphoglycerate mutase